MFQDLVDQDRRMAARSIASLSLSFGLVSIPIKLYSATESASAIRFKLMAAGGATVRQQYVVDAAPLPAVEAAEPQPAAEVEESAMSRDARPTSRVLSFPSARADVPEPPEIEPEPAARTIERSDMVKGYEFEKGKFVTFTGAELKALEEGARHTIDIVSFIPEHAVDPIYYDKAYFLAPDKRGAKPYSLLLRAMRDTRRSALAKWAFRSKEYVVQIRATEGGMVLQQLLYADEVRSLADLGIDQVVVSDVELQLARSLIEQSSADAYDPSQFVDEEKKRILAAVEEKIEGRQVVAPAHRDETPAAQVVDLVAALRASLNGRNSTPAKVPPSVVASEATTKRKPVRRAASKPATGSAAHASKA